jgi:tripartite-type tricarboxylate transporter receptor subunit TctC
VRKATRRVPRIIVPFAAINSSDLVLVARSGLPVNNLAELIAMAKAKPGALTYASSGPGTPYHPKNRS